MVSTIKDISESAELPLEYRQELLDFADYLANCASELILDLWNNQTIKTELKDDLTPVTQVDIQAERLIRELILKKYPDHGIIGEEFGLSNPASPFQWTVDPIDGTQNLANKIPTFGTLLGLRYNTETLIGIIDHPVLGIRTKGGIGLGVYHNQQKVVIEDLKDEEFTPNDLVVTNTLGVFRRRKYDGLYRKIIEAHPHTRIYYDCYAQTLAIANSVAVVIEPNLKIWDIAPAEVLVREAGGRFEYFGEQDSNLYNAVFGKPKAVSLIRKLASF